MEVTESNNIIRYSGETQPSKSTIKINEIPMDLSDDWSIEIRYKVPANTELPGGQGTATETTELVIDGVLTDPIRGKFSIYPHARVRYIDGKETAPITPNDYMTTEARAKIIQDKIDNEDMTEEEAEADTAPVNQVWDDEEIGSMPSLEYPFYIVRLKKYEQNGYQDAYVEEQVHNVGKVIIANRWLS